MVNQNLREKIANEGYENSIVYDAPSFDDSIIGVDDNGKTIYAFPLMINEYIKNDVGDKYNKLTSDELCELEDEAIDFISYNTVRGTPYMASYGVTPVIVDYNPDNECYYDIISGEDYDLLNKVAMCIDDKFEEFVEDYY